MNTCIWYEDCDSEPCGKMVEGRTDYCASHNKHFRDAEKIAKKQANALAKKLLHANERAKQPRAKVKPISDKQKDRIAKYNLLAEQFKKYNPECQIKANEYCTGLTSDVHHPEGKIGDKLFEVEKFKATCRSCHTYIHDHSKEAEEKGWTKSRLAKEFTEPHKI